MKVILHINTGGQRSPRTHQSFPELRFATWKTKRLTLGWPGKEEESVENQ